MDAGNDETIQKPCQPKARPKIASTVKSFRLGYYEGPGPFTIQQLTLSMLDIQTLSHQDIKGDKILKFVEGICSTLLLITSTSKEN